MYPFFLRYLHISDFLVKPKMAAILNDVTSQQRLIL